MVELVVQWMLEREVPSSIHAYPVSPTDTSSPYTELLLFKQDPSDTTGDASEHHVGSKRSIRDSMSSDDDDSSSSSGAPDGAAKRARMSLEERRARHREAQRQFAVRKKHQLDAMRKLVQSLEVRHQYLKLTQECAKLEAENAKLQGHYDALDSIRFRDVQDDETKEAR